MIILDAPWADSIAALELSTVIRLATIGDEVALHAGEGTAAVRQRRLVDRAFDADLWTEDPHSGLTVLAFAEAAMSHDFDIRRAAISPTTARPVVPATRTATARSLGSTACCCCLGTRS